MADPVLEARHITKRFPGVLANDDISFTLYQGEIHALLGENGAGKSTLMNIFYGLQHPDSGEIRVKGQPVRLAADVCRRLGDFALVAREPVVFLDPADTGEASLCSRHGSLTAAEVWVPLLASKG